MWGIFSWPLSLTNCSVDTILTQKNRSSISKLEEISETIDRIIGAIPPETQSTTKAALELLLPNLVGKTLNHEGRNSPVTYQVSDWFTPETPQRGRNKAQVPGFLTLRVEGSSREKRSAVGFDYYYFLWNKETETLKIARIISCGERWFTKKHFSDLWNSALKDSSLRQNEFSSTDAKKLGINMLHDDTIALVNFEKP